MEISIKVKTPCQDLLIDYIEAILADGTEVCFDWAASAYKRLPDGFEACLSYATINGKYPDVLPNNLESLVITDIQFGTGSHDGHDFPVEVTGLSITVGSDSVTLSGKLYFSGHAETEA